MSTVESPVRAGAARVVVTPPVGIPLGGYGSRELPSQSVHDDLTATALVFDDGSRRIGIISIDLGSLPHEHVETIRRRAQHEIGIPPDHLLLSFTHTHSGPMIGVELGYNEIIEPYRQNLVNQLVGVLSWAAGDLRPARLGYGRGDVQINVHRRVTQSDLGQETVLEFDPDGAVDREVAVVRVDDENGHPIAAMIRYPCHPVVLSRRSYG